jgi:hypothetical protein
LRCRSKARLRAWDVRYYGSQEERLIEFKHLTPLVPDLLTYLFG